MQTGSTADGGPSGWEAAGTMTVLLSRAGSAALSVIHGISGAGSDMAEL